MVKSGKVRRPRAFLAIFVHMMPLAALLLGLSLMYLLLCHWLLAAWRQWPSVDCPTNYVPDTFISVVIAARNEEAGILPCLHSVLTQLYPPDRFEVIVVDDHSDDNTAALLNRIHNPRLRVLKLADHLAANPVAAHKKKAIELGVRHTRGSWILHTDADCVVPADWLLRVAHYVENHEVVCLLGTVLHHQERNLLQRFQSLDFSGIMLCTAALSAQGLPLLANGACLAYTKAAFQAVGAYRGIDHLASGDDVLLVHKLGTRFPGAVHFLKHPAHVVLTPAMADLPAFLAQRTRWATKTGQYQNPATRIVLGSIFLLSLAILLLPLLALLLGRTELALLAAAMFLVKSLADYRLLREATHFYQRSDLLHPFLLMELLHLVYMVSTGFLGLLARRYTWKGRSLR